MSQGLCWQRKLQLTLKCQRIFYYTEWDESDLKEDFELVYEEENIEC